MRSFPLCTLAIIFLLWATQASAHIGAPDTYVNVAAGPYPLLVSVHPPATTPGATEIDIRSDDANITAISAALTNDSPTQLQRYPTEQIFTGSIWIKSPGTRRIHIHVSGTQGEADAQIPLSVDAPATPARWPFSPWLPLAIGFAALAIALSIAIKRPRKTIAATCLALVGAISLAAAILSPARPMSAATAMDVTPAPNSNTRLDLTLPGRMDDLVPDHEHLMHLFAVRQPQMDVLLHLHPTQTAPGHFSAQLPSMAPGSFALFADVVHVNGTLETRVAQAGLPAQTGQVLAGDDSIGIVPGLSRSTPITGPGSTTVRLPDGYTMTLTLASALHPRTGELLHLQLLTPTGVTPPDMQLYLGMTAHAAVFKPEATSPSVFAHIHPTGTLPMAAYAGSSMPMTATPTNEASFPFGFPTTGLYRVFIQMKHSTTIETAAFDLLVQ